MKFINSLKFLSIVSYSATLVNFLICVRPFWHQNPAKGVRPEITRVARDFLGYYHHSIYGEDFITASRNDLLTISTENIPNNINLEPFFDKDLPIELHKGPVIQLKSKNKMFYISAMADIAKRVLILVDYQNKRKNNSNYRVIYFKNLKSGHTLDDLIFARDYKNIGFEFCGAFKALDDATQHHNGPYFKPENESEIVYEDIYKWREIGLRILDYLVVASPEVDGYNEGKAIVKKVLEDSDIAKIVKKQFLQALNIEAFQIRNYSNIYDYIKQSIPNRGFVNVFSELSSEDKYDLMTGLIQMNLKKNLLPQRLIYPNRNLPFASIAHSFDNPEMLRRLASNLDQETESLGSKLINLVSFPQEIYDHKFWFWAYLIVEFLLSDKNSKFFNFFESNIKKSDLIEKIELFKRIITLNNRAAPLSAKMLPKYSQIDQMEVTEVWNQWADDRVVNWFYALWDKQDEYERDFKELKRDLKTHSLNSNKYLSEANHRIIQPEELLSAELGCWINSEAISMLLKTLMIQPAPKIHKTMQQYIIQRALMKNPSFIKYLDYKFKLWFGWNFSGKTIY
ncbi:expressed protein [Phakopsora pachyrhizi]|uniref:Expressed protein n=1 Tax=Phakopsora pachyrhizi TaxID=170000 RepID=A0AAV0BAB8_PHAPC|nr:expressed protein [Phakopsora pachyrhizi]